MIDIYRGGSVVISVHPSDSDKVTKKVMGENTLSLTVSLAAPFTFAVGDYLYFAGEKYTLNVFPKIKKTASNIFAYDLLFEGIEYELRKVRHLFYTQAMGLGGGDEFSLMGTAALHASVVVANLNRVQSGWSVGSVIVTSAKNLTFSGNSCLEAITKISAEFETEYWIGQDKTINVGKRGAILPVTFEYGQGKGLYSIERNNVSSKDIVTRLYAFGASSNLPKGYRNNAKRLLLAAGYIERNVATYGLIESSEIFEDIRPERIGTISALGADIFSFSDSSMDFDLNAKDGSGNTLYLVPGTTAKIHFQTGALAGYEFEVASYVHSTKTFTIIKFTDEVAYDLPNTTLKPAIGDTYILLDIYMPQSYVDAAEAKLLLKAQATLNQNSEPNLSYNVAVDPRFISNKGLTFTAGDYVGVKDAQLLIDRNIRLISITRKLAKPDEYDFELADSVEPSLTSQIITALERTDIVIQTNKLADPARARRNWRTAEELRSAIYDVDGYFDPENIKPFSIETSMLTVGSKGTQFYTDCMFQANYQGAKNNILVGNGSLAHFTIADTIKTWSITGLSATLPDDNLRYIYITCLKAGATGQVTLSATIKAIEEGNYYNFFAGVLSSVVDSARQVSLLFGFTTVNGRFIKTGRIQSANGNTYFDLDSEEIQGKITFKAGSSGYSQLTDKPDLTVFSEKTYVDAIKGDLQNQIDGVVDSWFYNYTPSLANAPASGWTTTDLKQRHVGDTFTNTQPFVDNATTPDAGKSWRWVNNSGVFSWTPIADSDAVKALQEAAKAKATADGKRRVFTAQPSAPYDAGDLWAKGTSIYKCDVPKLAGQAYAASDWSVTATDDTAAIAAKESADAANAKIGEMAADGKLTPVEKKSLKQLVDEATAEFTSIFNQGELHGVYTDSYGDEHAALIGYTTPLLANMTATSDVVRATLELRFSAYNSAKVALLEAINNTINGTATTALAQAAAVFPSDANLLAHWSFDEVSDMPDGAAAYRSKEKWAAGIDGWNGNFGVTTSVENGMLKVVGTNNNGASFRRTWDEGFRGKSIVVKVRSAQTIANIRYYNGADVVEANAIVIDQYSWIARFENIQVNNFGGLYMYVNHGLINQTAWIEYIYIGDCSYSSILKDNSGRNNTASLYGVNAHLGLSGKALNFSGSGYADLGNIGGQWEYTISFWFKKASLPAVPYETILGTTGGGAMEIEASTNGDGKINLYDWGMIKSPVYSLNAWHHVAISQNSSQVYLYMDGVQVASGATRIQLPAGMQLGRWMTSQHFSGSIDEFRLYNKALSASEILGLYKYITKGKAFAVDLEAKYLKEALKNDTEIQGGLVSTTLLKVGAVNEAGTWVAKAFINGSGSGANTPRFATGGDVSDAIARIGGDKRRPMSVITEGGKAFLDSGEIGGFNITDSGIEKEQVITDSDGVEYTGKVMLDWLNQRINFLRDSASKVLLSAKKLTTGIPSPANSSVAAGSWQTEVDVSAVTSYTSSLAPRVVLQPGGYNCAYGFNVRVVAPSPPPNYSYTVYVSYNVTVRVWITDANNNKISLLSSATTSVFRSNSNTLTGSIPISFSVENITGIAHEVEVSINNSSTSTYTDPQTIEQQTNLLLVDRFFKQNSLSFTASSESFEIGYSGLRVIAQNLWFYFNSRDSESKHLRMRGNAEIFSKGGNVTMSLTNTSVNASRISINAVMTNLITTSINYTFTAADKNATGIKVINSTYDALITLPDLNASEIVDGETIYYNNSRLLMVISTNRNCNIAAVSGQTVRGVASVNATTNTGWIFIGDKDRLNWLILGVG